MGFFIGCCIYLLLLLHIGGLYVHAVKQYEVPKDFCSALRTYPHRPYSVSIADFGAIGDGKALNTKAFQAAIAHLSSYKHKGGVQLYVPSGKWLTGAFNITISHFTLFLEKDAVILASEAVGDWPIVAPLPSYGRGRELPGNRYSSLIFGTNLTDVVITGNNGTIDGQGAIWWKRFKSGTLDHTRGPLLELMFSRNIIISNITLKDSPFWNVHPVYSRNVLIQKLTILAPTLSENTDGIDPDSCKYVCIEDSYIDVGDDLISIKSGWDEYGIGFDRPSSHIIIKNITGGTRQSSGIAFGSEMSGGISHVFVKGLLINHAIHGNGIRVKSAQGRGGYVKNIHVSDVVIRNTKNAIAFTDLYGDHPDDKYNANALPEIKNIFIENVKGYNVSLAGNFQGLAVVPFQNIFLRNMEFQATSNSGAWNCSNIKGYAYNVNPKPCAQFLPENNFHKSRWDYIKNLQTTLEYRLRQRTISTTQNKNFVDYIRRKTGFDENQCSGNLS